MGFYLFVFLISLTGLAVQGFMKLESRFFFDFLLTESMPLRQESIVLLPKEDNLILLMTDFFILVVLGHIRFCFFDFLFKPTNLSQLSLVLSFEFKLKFFIFLHGLKIVDNTLLDDVRDDMIQLLDFND